MSDNRARSAAAQSAVDESLGYAAERLRNSLADIDSSAAASSVLAAAAWGDLHSSVRELAVIAARHAKGSATGLPRQQEFRRLLDVLCDQADYHCHTIHRQVIDNPQTLAALEVKDQLQSVKFIGRALLGGARVTLLQFGTQNFIYKPYSLESQALWNEMITELWGHLDVESWTPKVWEFGDFALMEVAQNHQCTDLSQVRDFYYRYGAVLALAHALGTGDLHSGNIVSSGTYPVIIDAEVLMPTIFIEDYLEKINGKRSIMELALMPRTRQMRAVGSPPVPSISQDGALAGFHDGRRLPVLDGTVIGVGDYGDDLVDGFRQSMQVIDQSLIDKRIDRINNCEMRVFPRSLGMHTNVIRESLTERLLTNTVQRESFVKRRLQQLSAAGGLDPKLFADIEAEALMDLGTTRFAVKTTERQLTVNGKPIENLLLSAAPLELSRAFIDICTPEHNERQCSTLQIACSGPSSAADPLELDDSATALPEVRDIIQAITERAAVNPPTMMFGSCSTMDPDALVVSYGELPINLYSGYAGTGLALGLAGLTAEYKDLTVLATNQVQLAVGSMLRANSADPIQPDGLDVGNAGLALAASLLAEHHDDSKVAAKLSEGADKLAGYIKVNLHQRFDVLGGTAGAILLMLKINPKDANRKLAKSVIKGGQVIAQNARPAAGSKIWPFMNIDEPGLAHGAGGIQCAFAALFARTSDQRWLAAVDEIKPAQPYVPGDPTCRSGVAGALLSRIAVAQWTGRGADDESIAQIDALATELAAIRRYTSLSLYHGTTGAAVALLAAGTFLQRADLIDRAEELQLSALAGDPKQWRTDVLKAAPGYSPSLFTGTTGPLLWCAGPAGRAALAEVLIPGANLVPA